jgi:hypothetical protein
MKTYAGVDLQFHAYLTSPLDGSVVGFKTRPFYPRGMSPGIHWIGGWVDTRASLNAVAKKKIPCFYRESNAGLPFRSLVTILTELHRLRHCEGSFIKVPGTEVADGKTDRHYTLIICNL